MIYYKWIASPIGPLLLTSDGRSLSGLYLKGQKHFPTITEDWKESASLADALADPFEQTQAQLAEYFAHQRQSFDLPLNPQGTDFQKQVWQRLSLIPFGETISYGTLAENVGKPGASRAVGAANGRNPLSIIVPCHRVIAANGKLTGYAGGVDRKQWLLAHERSNTTMPKASQQSLALF
jgi:methylated-DNA-[protein]-cysteine S-methyltransferase